MNSTITLKKAIVVIIGIILFYVLFAIYSDLEKLQTIYQQINLLYLFPIIVILLCSLFFRSIVQKFLLNQIGIQLSIRQSFLLFLTGLSMIVTPGGTGQMIKSHFLKEQHGHPISKSLPLVYAERFHDLLAISILVTLSLFVSFSIESLIACLISFSLVAILILIAKNRIFFTKLICLLSKIKLFRNQLPDDSHFTDSLQKLFKNNIIIKTDIIVFSLFLFEGIIIYMGFLAFDVDLGYLKSIQFFYTSIIFGAISLIPGGVGVVEGGFTALLTQQSLPLALAISIVIFIRLTTVWFATIIGFIAMYFNMRKK